MSDKYIVNTKREYDPVQGLYIPVVTTWIEITEQGDIIKHADLSATRGERK